MDDIGLRPGMAMMALLCSPLALIIGAALFVATAEEIADAKSGAVNPISLPMLRQADSLVGDYDWPLLGRLEPAFVDDGETVAADPVAERRSNRRRKNRV